MSLSLSLCLSPTVPYREAGERELTGKIGYIAYAPLVIPKQNNPSVLGMASKELTMGQIHSPLCPPVVCAFCSQLWQTAGTVCTVCVLYCLCPLLNVPLPHLSVSTPSRCVSVSRPCTCSSRRAPAPHPLHCLSYSLVSCRQGGGRGVMVSSGS